MSKGAIEYRSEAHHFNHWTFTWFARARLLIGMMQIEHRLAVHVNSTLMVRLKFVDGRIRIGEKVPRESIASNRMFSSSLMRPLRYAGKRQIDLGRSTGVIHTLNMFLQIFHCFVRFEDVSRNEIVERHVRSGVRDNGSSSDLLAVVENDALRLGVTYRDVIDRTVGAYLDASCTRR